MLKNITKISHSYHMHETRASRLYYSYRCVLFIFWVPCRSGVHDTGQSGIVIVVESRLHMG